MKPDVVVLDISMPILNGLDAGDQVKRLLPTVKLIYLTMSSDPQLAAEALSRGALGYLVKPAPALNCWSLCAVFFEASLISLPTCAKMRSMRFVGRRKA